MEKYRFVFCNKIYQVYHNGLQMILEDDSGKSIDFPCDELWQLAYDVLHINMEEK